MPQLTAAVNALRTLLTLDTSDLAYLSWLCYISDNFKRLCLHFPPIFAVTSVQLDSECCYSESQLYLYGYFGPKTFFWTFRHYTAEQR